MTTLREAAQQALEVLVRASSYYDTYAEIAALEAALAEEALQRLTDVQQEIEAALAEPQEPPCATRECMPSECPNCVSLQDQNTELDRKLAELERKPMNEFDALRLVTESIGRLQSAGPVEGLIGLVRAVERAHGIT